MLPTLAAVKSSFDALISVLNLIVKILKSELNFIDVMNDSNSTGYNNDCTNARSVYLHTHVTIGHCLIQFDEKDKCDIGVNWATDYNT